MTPEQRPEIVFLVLSLCILLVIVIVGCAGPSTYQRPEANMTALGWAGLVVIVIVGWAPWAAK